MCAGRPCDPAAQKRAGDEIRAGMAGQIMAHGGAENTVPLAESEGEQHGTFFIIVGTGAMNVAILRAQVSGYSNKGHRRYFK